MPADNAKKAKKQGYKAVDKSSHPVQKAGQRSTARAGSQGWISASQGGTSKAGYKGAKTTGIEKKLAAAGYGESKSGHWSQVSAAYGGYDNSKKTARLMQKAQNKGLNVGSKREQEARSKVYAGKRGTINLETGSIWKYDNGDPFANFGKHDLGTVSPERLAALREKAGYVSTAATPAGPTGEARRITSPRVGGGGEPVYKGGEGSYADASSGPLPPMSPIYAEANATTTGYGAMQGRDFGKGTAGTSFGATGGGDLIPTEDTAPKGGKGGKGHRGGRNAKGHRGNQRHKGHSARGRNAKAKKK